MSIPLTEEQQMVRAMVREFARKEIAILDTLIKKWSHCQSKDFVCF